jgi:hypothetical protein
MVVALIPAAALIPATDWAEVTALATVGLALLTLALVTAAVVAAHYAKQDVDAHLRTSAEDLKATREATEAAQRAVQRQIEASHRPLLIDVTETTSKPSDLDPEHDVLLTFHNGEHVAQTDWRHVYVGYTPGRIFVAVPLRNVGSGVAVLDTAGVRVTGDGIDKQPMDQAIHRERVPPGETTRILCAHNVKPSVKRRRLQVLVPYQDFAGSQATVADVRLVCGDDDQWHVQSVTPVAPDRIVL